MANLLVIVSYKVFPAHMGGQKGIVLFYQYLQAHHRLHLAVSHDNEADKVPYPVEKTLHAHRRMAFNLFKLPALYRMVRRHQIQCVIAEHSYTAWLALALRRLTGVPFMIHSHNNEASRFRQMGKPGWKLYGRYERWIHRKANFNFFKTEEEKTAAIAAYGLAEKRCLVVPYGIETKPVIKDAKALVKSRYSIISRYIFYFNGTLDYTPNRQAVEYLVETINPLLTAAGLDFTILISGKWLSEDLQKRIAASNTIRYLGFADDAGLLYAAADLFLNPVLNDSGIKTKVVEALAHHCTVVSTVAGAAGIPTQLCPQKLLTAADGDWTAFAETIHTSLRQPAGNTPEAFFAYFAWQNIAEKAAASLHHTIKHAERPV